MYITVDMNLQKGRRALITTFGGIRYKLKTIDGNFIDSMFIDKRFVLFTIGGCIFYYLYAFLKLSLNLAFFFFFLEILILTP